MKTKILLTIFLNFICLGTFASENLECFGTEPFWGALISEKAIHLNLFDKNPNNRFSVTAKTQAEGTTSNFAFSLSASNSKSELLKMNIIKSSCNDGMSDREYPYTALLEVRSVLFYGCCK